jgi:hypothetical protein
LRRSAIGLGALSLLGWRRKRNSRASLLGAAKQISALLRTRRPVHDPATDPRREALPGGRLVIGLLQKVDAPTLFPVKRC